MNVLYSRLLTSGIWILILLYMLLFIRILEEALSILFCFMGVSIIQAICNTCAASYLRKMFSWCIMGKGRNEESARNKNYKLTKTLLIVFSVILIYMQMHTKMAM